VKANRGEDVDLEALSKDMTDPGAYEVLARGDTLGVFQLDGGGTRTLLRLMQPTRFEDISATIALYRPGPMGINSHTNYALRKNGRQPITPIHPELAEPLDEILGATYGLIVYQEHVIQIAQKVAGYTLGRADLLRKAMGKKKKEVLGAEFAGFEAGMQANGYSADAIKTLWDALMPFADYGFNKAHAKAYALISYWTAYLKGNYPAEYMAALLTSVRDDKDKSALYLGECRHMGIKVLPPDVNESVANFAAVGTDIRFGMAAIRNVGANVVAEIVKARTEKGAYASFKDFLGKVPAVVCNKRTIESLIKAGAFDSLGESRRGMLEVHDRYVDALVEVKRQEALGQDSLFGAFGAFDLGDDGVPGLAAVDGLPPVPRQEWDKQTLLTFEREMLGLYVSDHPLFGIEHVLSQHADTTIAVLTGDEPKPDGTPVTIAGLITGLQIKRTKKGDLWAIATVEDLEGAIECLFFPSAYATVAPLLRTDVVCVVRGRVSSRDDAVSVYAQELTLPDIKEGPRGPVVVSLPLARATDALAEELRRLLGEHPGATEVHLKLTQPGRSVLMRIDDRLRVTASPALFGDLKALLGPSCLS
jgi:DNA polymerase-3 subunit alpha